MQTLSAREALLALVLGALAGLFAIGCVSAKECRDMCGAAGVRDWRGGTECLCNTISGAGPAEAP